MSIWFVNGLNDAFCWFWHWHCETGWVWILLQSCFLIKLFSLTGFHFLISLISLNRTLSKLPNRWFITSKLTVILNKSISIPPSFLSTPTVSVFTPPYYIIPGIYLHFALADCIFIQIWWTIVVVVFLLMSVVLLFSYLLVGHIFLYGNVVSGK